MKEIAVVCALADVEMTVPGAVFDRVCSKCARRVMIAPSGQRMLEAHPGAAISSIICMVCFVDLASAGKVWDIIEPTDEQMEELKGAIPNVRRERN